MTWTIDTSHSRVNFSARHMVIATVRGEFQKFTVDFDFNEQNLAASKVAAHIDAASLETRDARRDEHLRSADFLDVANYPEITFVSNSVNVIDTHHAKIGGDLTIHGVTKPVVLDVEYSGMIKNPWGKTQVGFSASTKIARKDWGLVWNVVVEGGSVLVGEEVTINIEAEFAKVEETVPADAQKA